MAVLRIEESNYDFDPKQRSKFYRRLFVFTSRYAHQEKANQKLYLLDGCASRISPSSDGLPVVFGWMGKRGKARHTFYKFNLISNKVKVTK